MKRSEFAKYADLMARAAGSVGPDYNYGLDGNVSANGHRGDVGKLPNHPTFSVESAYSTQQNPGGKWITDFQGTRFRPSLEMWMRPGYANMIGSYMRNVEPNVALDDTNKIKFVEMIR